MPLVVTHPYNLKIRALDVCLYPRRHEVGRKLILW
jgi:hypothetical protein